MMKSVEMKTIELEESEWDESDDHPLHSPDEGESSELEGVLGNKRERPQQKRVSLVSSSESSPAWLRRAFIFCCFIKFISVGGIIALSLLGSSLLLLGEAIQMFADISVILISIYLVNQILCGNPQLDPIQMRRNAARIECSFFLLINIISWSSMGILAYLIFYRIGLSLDFEAPAVDPFYILYGGILSLSSNLLTFLILFLASKKQIPVTSASAHQWFNLRAVFVHLFSNSLQSLGVIGASLIILLGNQIQTGDVRSNQTRSNMIDPLVAFLFLIVSLLMSIRVMKNFIFILIEDVSSDIDKEELAKDLKSVEGVDRLDCLRIWCTPLGGHHLVAKVVSSHSQPYRVLQVLKDVVSSFNINQSLIEVSPLDLVQETTPPKKTNP